MRVTGGPVESGPAVTGNGLRLRGSALRAAPEPSVLASQARNGGTE